MPNSKVPSKQKIFSIDGHEVVVRRKLKYKCRIWDIDETMKLAMEINEWADKMKFVGTEKGIHWDSDFFLFACEYKGHNLLAKAKSTEGLILYTLRLTDIFPQK